MVQAQATLAVLDDIAGAFGQAGDLLSVKQGDDDAHVSTLPTMLIGGFGRPIGSVEEKKVSEQKISLNC
jgi:hypothetical protein